VVWNELCVETQESFGLRSENVRGVWDALRSAPVAVIDDLDKTVTTEWAMSKLMGVINVRYQADFPTIITANESLNELRSEWSRSRKRHLSDTGSAVLSRIAGQAITVVNFDGEDYRTSQ